MKHRLSLASLIVVSTTIGLLGAAAPAYSETVTCTPGTWTLQGVPSFPGAVLTGVHAVSPTDVWAVGSYSNPENSPSQVDALAVHWDGMSWTQVPIDGDGVNPPPAGGDGQPVSPPYFNQLNAVTVVPGSPNEIWAVGTTKINGNSSAQHLIEYSSDGGVNWDYWVAAYGTLHDVHAFGPDNVWAVGSNGNMPEVAHFGSAGVFYVGYVDWNSPTYVPVPEHGDHGVLYGLSASSAGDIWAVGKWWNDSDSGVLTDKLVLIDPDVVEGRPSTGLIVPAALYTPNASYGQLNDVVTLSPTDAWAVGEDQNGDALVERWDGASWSVTSAGEPRPPLTSVVASSDADLWMFDSAPALEHWDGNVLSRFPVDPGFSASSSMSALPSGEAWATGATVEGPTVAYLCPISVADVPVSRSAALNASTGPEHTTSRIIQGGTVTWKFDAGNAERHRVREATEMHLFDSGLRAAEGSYVRRFPTAGTFEWIDPVSLAAGVVRVPIVVKPARGSGATVTWSLARPPKDFVFDVQIRRPGATRYDFWKRGVTSLKSASSPSKHGIYEYRARIRYLDNGAHSAWSPVATFKRT